MVDDYEAFFAAHYSRVRRALMRAFRSAEVADDAAQEAFVVLDTVANVAASRSQPGQSAQRSR